jgi:hypothetical protein
MLQGTKRLRMLSAGINFAHRYYDVNDGKAERDECEWEPYYGSKFGRVRQATFLKTPPMNDETARAGEDPGILWA